MDETLLVTRIRDYAMSMPDGIPFAPASEDVIKEAESELGFRIPELLRLCYLHVGNGGFGPGYGVFGLKGGFKGDCGTLVDEYRCLKEVLVSKGKGSKTVLPFCEFGDNMNACVDYADAKHVVYSFDQGRIWREKYTLKNFFEMWIEGVDYSSLEEGVEIVETEIINPFTKKKEIIRTRRRAEQE
jgi:SMI1 / KNR4 family (SUKH-1)